VIFFKEFVIAQRVMCGQKQEDDYRMTTILAPTEKAKKQGGSSLRVPDFLGCEM
jgi:hypothetical protein